MKEGGDGANACLSMDGNYQLTIKSIKRNEKPSEKGNITASAVLIVQDTDPEGAKGGVIYHAFPISGSVASGPNAGRSNVGTLIDMCTSANRQDLLDLMVGKKFDVDHILAELSKTGKTVVYSRLVQRENDQTGKMESKPLFYIKGSKYEETKQSGANFRVLPNARKRPTPGATAPLNGTAVATDSMASEV